MASVLYRPWRLAGPTADFVEQVIDIAHQYLADGYTMTLRQLYYQVVAHDLFPDDRCWRRLDSGRWVRDPDGTKNAEPNYKWLGDFVTRARMAGMLDWDAVEDRTRAVWQPPAWDGPRELLDACASQYNEDVWDSQPRRVEVWIEKEALAGVVVRPSERAGVPYFCCRGYVSKSEMRVAALRLLGHLFHGQAVTVLHLGDHDPSGVDMTRDIRDQLTEFITFDWARARGPVPDPSAEEVWDSIAETTGVDPGQALVVERIALNMDQIRRYQPPPNPAKIGDSRSGKYIEQFGEQSWELDSLPPNLMEELITAEVERRCNLAWLRQRRAEVEGQRTRLREIAATWGGTP
jgi:hypothetical protein